MTLRVAATDAADGAVFGRVTAGTGAGKAVTFARRTPSWCGRTRRRTVQEVLLGGKVVASTSSATAALGSRGPAPGPWPGRAATVQVTGSGRYGSHQRPGLPVRRDGRQPHARRHGPQPRQRLAVGDEYLSGVPEVAVLLGLTRRRRAAGPGPGRPHLRLHGVPRRRLPPRCDCHLYDGTISQTFDGYRVEPGPERPVLDRARLGKTTNSVITYQGQPDRRDLLLRVGRPDDGRARRVGQQHAPTCAASTTRSRSSPPWAATPSATPTCPGPPRCRRPRMARWSACPGCSRCRSPGGPRATPRPS